MNSHTRSISHLASASLLLLLAVGALSAQTISPSGSFGFLLGTSFADSTNQGGAAILGLMNFDGSGNVKGPFTLEYGSGGPLPVETITGTFKGTYSSNPDGTGSIAMSLSNGVSLTLAMVSASSGHGLQLVATSCAGGAIDLSVSVFSGVAVRAKGFTLKSLAALQGSYGSQSTLSPQPSRSINVLSFDGAGNITFSITFVGSGPSVFTATYTGTYTVSLNATGSIALAATTDQGPQTFVFVITDEGGPGLLYLQTNRSGNGVLFGTAQLE